MNIISQYTIKGGQLSAVFKQQRVTTVREDSKREDSSSMDFQVVQVNKEDKIVVVTLKNEYTFTPDRYNTVIMVYLMCIQLTSQKTLTTVVSCIMCDYKWHKPLQG